MAQDDATFGAPGGEPTPTPEAAPPIPADFMSSVMARFARQDEVQKMTNDQLAALVAALTAPDGQTSRPQMKRQEKAPKDDGEDDSSADEEQPANRMRIEVMLSQQTLSSDDENDDAPIPGDLRNVLKRKLESKDGNSSENTDLRLTLDARKSQRTSTGSPDPKGHPTRLSGDLQDKLNASVCDLRVLLNSSKPIYLCRRLEQTKTPGNPMLSQNDDNASADLRALLNSKRVKTKQRLNVIMGDSPPCGNYVRSVKDYCWQVATSQRWPTRPPNHPPITFSPDDTAGIHVPHSDPLLVILGIGEYDVMKVLIDTGSSVDLIFRGVLQKMGVDLDDIKASSRTLTGFNGSSKTILGTIRLPVRACGVTRTVKFAVAPKDDGEDDSSADEEQPANRRRIEVILSQQILSSDDKNDDAPIPGDREMFSNESLSPRTTTAPEILISG
ncbi:hypothetical protein F2Q70_00022486 [Brassica cretica]|uniref:Peptidase A2 domain-containing protein n=1 Tax=Brassica cretica TaxID=69181 RepID=A0A8S9GQY1_BRACR|nr:hypothetical protein F2Q70_00022486 [Brassica cretica]